MEIFSKYILIVAGVLLMGSSCKQTDTQPEVKIENKCFQGKFIVSERCTSGAYIQILNEEIGGSVTYLSKDYKNVYYGTWGI